MSNPRIPMNVISLDDLEDNPSLLSSKLEEARNKTIIQEAEFTNDPFELCVAVVKTCIKGDLAIKNRQLNKTILKYFQQKINMKISYQCFQPRPEPDYSDPQTVPNLQELILYGVDFLTTNSIRDRLKAIETEIKEIVWINDSTCKIVCKSEQEAERILNSQVDFIKIDEEQERDIRRWHFLKPYSIFSFQRNLWLRYATSRQTSIERKKSSKYEDYSKSKKQLASYLLKKFNAQQRYKETIEEIEKKKYSRPHQSNKRDAQIIHSRSRQKNENRVKKHHQRVLLQESQNKRQNRFNKFNNQSFKPLPRKQITKIRYEHIPIVEKPNDFSFDQGTKIQKEIQKMDGDFQFNCKKNIKIPAFDAISEDGSDLSFIFDRNKDEKKQDSRMDIHYELRNQLQNSDNDDLQYQQLPRRQNIISHNKSFQNSKIPISKDNKKWNDSFSISNKNSKGLSYSDFFDFKDIKKEIFNAKDSPMDNSFNYDKKETKANKKAANHFDDDSY